MSRRRETDEERQHREFMALVRAMDWWDDSAPPDSEPPKEVDDSNVEPPPPPAVPRVLPADQPDFATGSRLQHGSRIVLTERGPLLLASGHCGEFTRTPPSIGLLGERALDVWPGDEYVFDLAVTAERVTALVQADDIRSSEDKRIVRTTLGLDTSDVSFVPNSVHRVAITASCTFIADHERVLVCEGDCLIARQPIDIASSEALLAVLDPSGLCWFDDVGTFISRTPLNRPSAIARDAVDGGWLVVVDEGIAHITGPGGNWRLLHPAPDGVRKLRRTVSAVYVLDAGRKLHEVRQNRTRIVTTLPWDGSQYWPDFDASPERGLVIIDGLGRLIDQAKASEDDE